VTADTNAQAATAPLLYHHEPILREGRRVGEMRAGAYEDTLGGAVGLGVLEDEGGITQALIDTGGFEIEIAGTCDPATASLRPMYDPDRARIKS